MQFQSDEDEFTTIESVLDSDSENSDDLSDSLEDEDNEKRVIDEEDNNTDSNSNLFKSDFSLQKGKSYKFAYAIVSTFDKTIQIVAKRFNCDSEEISLLSLDDEEKESIASPLSVLIDKKINSDNPEFLLAIAIIVVSLPRVMYLYEKYDEERKKKLKEAKKLKDLNSVSKSKGKVLDNNYNLVENDENSVYVDNSNDDYYYGDDYGDIDNDLDEFDDEINSDDENEGLDENE